MNEHDTPPSDLAGSTDEPLEARSSITIDDTEGSPFDPYAEQATRPDEAEESRFDYDSYYGVDPDTFVENADDALLLLCAEVDLKQVGH